MTRETTTWTVVIPVKRLPDAKSRLRSGSVSGSVSGAPVDDLALAFALDTVAAALAASMVGTVIVVSSDSTVAARVRELGTGVLDDPGGGLNAAIASGVNDARAIDPGAAVAVLTGDLPALRPADLDTALTAAAEFDLAIVADHDGTGTTMLTALAGHRLEPRFGTGSRERHERAGHTVLDIPLESSVRWDVDTPADLERAVTSGTGPHTERARGVRRERDTR